MPLIAPVHESLPYIDVDITVDERTAALALITAELDPAATSAHPSLPPPSPESFSPRVLGELARIQDKLPLRAIDLSRYESQDTPSNTECHLTSWHSALRSAYISKTYLNNRQKNLERLDKYGKTAWLLGNSQLEDILRDLERDLANKKTEIDICVIQRKSAQEAVGSEIKGLEENWKRGVGAILETEIAAERLRKEILERLRDGAS